MKESLPLNLSSVYPEANTLEVSYEQLSDLKKCLDSCQVPCDHAYIPERSYALYKTMVLLPKKLGFNNTAQNMTDIKKPIKLFSQFYGLF